MLIQKQKNLEIDTYDEIGMLYYKMNEIEKAKVFHDKAINGYTEPNESSMRINNLWIKTEKILKKSVIPGQINKDQKEGQPNLEEFFMQQDLLVAQESSESEDEMAKNMFSFQEKNTSKNSYLGEFNIIDSNTYKKKSN